MLEMNAEAGRREFLNRLGSTAQRPAYDAQFNTGATMSAGDAYVYMWLTSLQHHGSAEPIQTAWPCIDRKEGTSGVIWGCLKIQPTTMHVVIPTPELVSPASIVTAIRKQFGLNVKEAADVFAVTRPTIYSWMNLADMGMVRAENTRTRMLDLYRIARFWSTQQHLIGSWQTAVLKSGRTVMDLLREDALDLIALKEAHAELMALAQVLRKRESENAIAGLKLMSAAFRKAKTKKSSSEGNPAPAR